MRYWKITATAGLAVLVVLAFAGQASAFHASAELVCQNCHTMHNSQGGTAVDGDNPNGNDYLLTKSSATDVCLTCHGDASFGGIGNTWTSTGTGGNAGGDFYWVAQADNNGHNVISVDGNVSVDATLSTAPGGTYDSNNLTCSQCHDPHGNGNFRILYGAGDKAHITVAAPTGIKGLDEFAGVEADNDHNAYTGGMGAWCSNCHTNFHGSANNGGGASPFHRHPTASTDGGTFPAAMVTDYGATYVANVPFEDPEMTADSTAGPDSTNSSAMCLSCHRAHAANGDSGRWVFTTASGTGTNCNQCHAK